MPTATASREITLTPEQRCAVETLVNLSKPVQVLAGHAGVGKTTVIKTLQRRLPGFAVCAFTGKAANVLRRKGVPASTIHSLIYGAYEVQEWDDDLERMVKRVKFMLKERDALQKVRGFICDEASMLGANLLSDLTHFGKPIIFVGDHGQLEPVMDRGCDLMRNPDIVLEQVHRNAGEIARFAEFLRFGNPSREWPKHEGSDGSQVRLTTLQDCDFDGDQIICAFNRTRVSLNRANRSALGFPHDSPVVGDRVMCLQNSRELGIWNRQQGTIAKIDAKALTFLTEEGAEVECKYVHEQFNSEERPEGRDDAKRIPFDYCYAATAHSCQGDEWDDVMVIEQRCGGWSHPRWCYTSASRARKSLTWIPG